MRIGQIIAAARRQRGVKLPVPFDEFHDRGMLVIDVADTTASRVGRHGDHWNARTGAEEIDRLDESRVIIAAALVNSDLGAGRERPQGLSRPFSSRRMWSVSAGF